MICLLRRSKVRESSIVNILFKENRMIGYSMTGITHNSVAHEFHYRQKNQECDFKLVDRARLQEKMFHQILFHNIFYA
jgi:predicted GTPase